MKLLIAMTVALSITGCASKWDEYATTNGCVATQETMNKTEVQMQQSTGVGVMSTSVSPSVRMKTYRRFDCSNGSIWGPV